ncbi:MAG TPA: hypothetical protein VHT53_12830 [Candidatus Elarobacter sp.]|nr:hypothetical protein [Candidatus Elarobacter sp.]
MRRSDDTPIASTRSKRPPRGTTSGASYVKYAPAPAATPAAAVRVNVQLAYGRLNVPAGYVCVYFAMRSVLEGGGCTSTSSRSAPVASNAFQPYVMMPPARFAPNDTTRAPPSGTTTARTCGLRSTIAGMPS